MANAHIRGRLTNENTGILTGAGGADYVAASGSDVTLNAHTYVAITAFTATVATVTSVDTDIWDSGALAIPAGVTVYGRWSAVVIADGDTAYVYRESSAD